MSNEVTLFKSGVPSYLKSQPLNAITKSLLSGGGGGGKRISIRGNMFRLVVNGEEVATREERSMPVVIVNVAPDVSRAYYDKAFVPGQKASPVCWSANGKTPDEKSSDPQSKTCANCPKNVKGSGSNGKGAACKYDRLIAEAARELDPAQRFAILRQAEDLLVQKAVPVCPIYYYVGIQLYDPAKLGGIRANVLDEHPLRRIHRKN